MSVKSLWEDVNKTSLLFPPAAGFQFAPHHCWREGILLSHFATVLGSLAGEKEGKGRQ